VVELTSTEFDLLHLLAREPGKVFNRDDILNQLRGHDAELYTRAVDIVVSRLRKKLEPLDAIKTLRNAGYALALRATLGSRSVGKQGSAGTARPPCAGALAARAL
jgi:OmpR family response regulator RpaB